MTNQYENRGVLFRNKFKQGNQPDYKGKLTLNGEEDQLSAWVKRDKNGEEFLSLARTPADEAAKYAKPKQEADQKPSKTDNEDQIPF
jgi:hypothetical protein